MVALYLTELAPTIKGVFYLERSWYCSNCCYLNFTYRRICYNCDADSSNRLCNNFYLDQPLIRRIELALHARQEEHEEENEEATVDKDDLVSALVYVALKRELQEANPTKSEESDDNESNDQVKGRQVSGIECDSHTSDPAFTSRIEEKQSLQSSSAIGDRPSSFALPIILKSNYMKVKKEPIN